MADVHSYSLRIVPAVLISSGRLFHLRQSVLQAFNKTSPSSTNAPFNAATQKEIQKQLAKGADLWIWGITPETVEKYNEILPLPVALDPLKRSSFLPVQKAWMHGLNNSDFYFCELQKAAFKASLPSTM